MFQQPTNENGELKRRQFKTKKNFKTDLLFKFDYELVLRFQNYLSHKEDIKYYHRKLRSIYSSVISLPLNNNFWSN